MPLPTPQSDEAKDAFIERFMADPTAIEDFPDESQRIAVAEQQWESRSISNVSIQLNGAKAQRIQFKGRPHLRVPAVLLREMVLHGAGGYEDGPAFVPFDEIKKTAPLWNGAPIVLGHAMSGRDKDEIDQRFVGTVFEVQPQEQNKTLNANLYFDIERLQSTSITDFLGTHNGNEILQKLEAGEMVELSTGYPAQRDQTQGTYNGKQYTNIQRNIMPDHLGVFSSVKGACSINDGCGVNRLNAEGEIIESTEDTDMKDNADPVMTHWQKFTNAVEHWLDGTDTNNTEPGGTMSQHTEPNREELVEFIRNNSDIDLPENVVEDTENYSDCRLNGMKQGIEAAKQPETPEEPETTSEPEKTSVDRDAVLNALGMDAGEFDAIRNTVKSDQEQRKAEKDRLVEAIHEKQIYNLSKEDLEKTPLETLQAMAPSGYTDHTVNGGAPVEDEVPMPPKVLGRAAYNAAQKDGE